MSDETGRLSMKHRFEVAASTDDGPAGESSPVDPLPVDEPEEPVESVSAWRSVGKSGGVRVLLLPLSAVLGLINTRLIIEHFGQSAYAQYGLLVGIAALIPFADLGISAAVMNSAATARDPRTDENFRLTLVTCFRILAGSTVVVLLVSLVLTLSGAWPALLGEGLLPGSGPVAAGLCLGIIGLTLTVGYGQRIMTGLGRNHVAIAILGMQTPVMLVVLLIMTSADVPGGAYLAVIAYLIIFLLAAVLCWRAARLVSPAIGSAFRSALRWREARGAKVFDTAWPLLVQMIALPIAMQTDRLVLSHVATLRELNEYSFASQIYTPVWQVTNAAGVALWPIFARARARKTGDAGPSPTSFMWGFAGVAAMVCLALSLASPWLASVGTDDQIHPPIALLVTFAIFMILQAAKYPLGMYMTDARGLRYQAYFILLLVPLNLGLSIPLAMRFGAVGPVIGSAISVLLCQVLANYVYVVRDRRVRLAAADVEPAR